MRVSKWGNSLAFRIPTEIVEELGLKEGDEGTLSRKGPNTIELEVPVSLKDQITWIQANTEAVSTGWKFNREEVYDESGRR